MSRKLELVREAKLFRLLPGKNESSRLEASGVALADDTTALVICRLFCLVETLEDFDGRLRGFVAEYDSAGNFLRCTRLHTRFQKENKGFEGLVHIAEKDQSIHVFQIPR